MPNITKLNTSNTKVQILRLESCIQFGKYLLAAYREIKETFKGKIGQAR